MNTLSSVLPASEARNNFYTLLDEVSNKLRSFTISLRGRIKAVMIHPDELESWRETIALIGDRKLMKELNQSETEFKLGDYLTEDELIKNLGINKKIT